MSSPTGTSVPAVRGTVSAVIVYGGMMAVLVPGGREVFPGTEPWTDCSGVLSASTIVSTGVVLSSPVESDVDFGLCYLSSPLSAYGASVGAGGVPVIVDSPNSHARPEATSTVVSGAPVTGG